MHVPASRLCNSSQAQIVSELFPNRTSNPYHYWTVDSSIFSGTSEPRLLFHWKCVSNPFVFTKPSTPEITTGLFDKTPPIVCLQHSTILTTLKSSFMNGNELSDTISVRARARRAAPTTGSLGHLRPWLPTMRSFSPHTESSSVR